MGMPKSLMQTPASWDDIPKHQPDHLTNNAVCAVREKYYHSFGGVPNYETTT